MGQSDRSLGVKIKEHFPYVIMLSDRDTRSRNIPSPFSKHLNSLGYLRNHNNVKLLLYACSKGTILNILEVLEIKKLIVAAH